MSNIPITSLPIMSPLTGEEDIPGVQAGTTKRTTTGAISALPIGQGTANSGISFITVSSSFAALPNSRTLAGSLPITITDNGTGNTIVIGLSFTPGSGTVTSVGLSGGTTGLTISNSPITINGTMTLGGYLNGTAIATASITSTQIATNTVGFSKIQQSSGLSVVGVAGASAATLGSIVGTASQTLRVNSGGTAIEFGPIFSSLFIGASDINLAAGTTKYVGTGQFDLNEDNVKAQVPFGFLAKSFRVTTGGSPGVGQTYTFTLRKDKAATALSITISGTSTSGSDLVNQVSFTAGQFIDIQAVPSAGASNTGSVQGSLAVSVVPI